MQLNVDFCNDKIMFHILFSITAFLTISATNSLVPASLYTQMEQLLMLVTKKISREKNNIPGGDEHTAIIKCQN